MKKNNYNIIVFVAAAVLIVGAWCTVHMPSGIKNAIVDFVKEPNLHTFIDNIDKASNNISYKGLLVDAYSLTYRLNDTRVVEKPDSTVVRMNNDYLAFAHTKHSVKVLAPLANQCALVKEATDELGIPFVYALTPTKDRYGEFPSEVANHGPENTKKWASLLKERNIDVFDLGNEMKNQNISLEEAFFVTDHHWKPETALWAAGQLCNYLKDTYGYEYDEAVFDLENYEVETYEDCFLGTQGKKTGQYFTPLGLDDFTIITPAFETNVTVADGKSVISGTLSETLITTPKNIGKNIHYKNIYTTYSGGNYGLQIIENHLPEQSSPKVFIIRDSFACPFTPFLALTTSSLHVIDARYWAKDESLIKYIKSEKPDYVIILYSDVTENKFSF